MVVERDVDDDDDDGLANPWTGTDRAFVVSPLRLCCRLSNASDKDVTSTRRSFGRVERSQWLLRVHGTRRTSGPYASKLFRSYCSRKREREREGGAFVRTFLPIRN